jgi:hypothetical protein
MAASNEHPPDGWAFLGIGDPLLVVHDERRGLLAVAGTDADGRTTPVAVHQSRSFVRRALIHSRFPVHAMAFHPRRALLAVGTGRYDGGYFFEGELLLLHLKTVRSSLSSSTGSAVRFWAWSGSTNSHSVPSWHRPTTGRTRRRTSTATSPW